MCVTTWFVAAIYDRRTRFFKAFGAPRKSGAGSERRYNAKSELSPRLLSLGEGLLALFFNTDLQCTQELSVLVREAKLGIVALLRRQFLAVYEVAFAPFIKSDGNFQYQEEIITCRPDSPHDLGNPVRFEKGIIDGASQFLNQALEIVVEVQKSPGIWKLVQQRELYDSPRRIVKVKGLEDARQESHRNFLRRAEHGLRGYPSSDGQRDANT